MIKTEIGRLLSNLTSVETEAKLWGNCWNNPDIFCKYFEYSVDASCKFCTDKYSLKVLEDS